MSAKKTWDREIEMPKELGSDPSLVSVRITKKAHAALTLMSQKYEMEISDLFDRFVFARVSDELKALRGVDLTKEILERGTRSLH